MAGVLWTQGSWKRSTSDYFNAELAREMELDEREIVIDKHMLSVIHDMLSEVRLLFTDAVNLQKGLLEEMRDAVKIEASKDPLLKKELKFVIDEESRKIKMNSALKAAIKDMTNRSYAITDMCKTLSKDDSVMLFIDKSITGESVDLIRKAM